MKIIPATLFVGSTRLKLLTGEKNTMSDILCNLKVSISKEELIFFFLSLRCSVEYYDFFFFQIKSNFHRKIIMELFCDT